MLENADLTGRGLSYSSIRTRVRSIIPDKRPGKKVNFPLLDQPVDEFGFINLEVAAYRIETKS